MFLLSLLATLSTFPFHLFLPLSPLSHPSFSLVYFVAVVWTGAILLIKVGRGKNIARRMLFLNMSAKRKVQMDTNDLLTRLLPSNVIPSLLEYYKDPDPNTFIAHSYPNVSMLQADIVHFTSFCARTPPADVVWMLNDLFFIFDQLTDFYSVYKVETIGDAYLAIAGAPIPVETHAIQIVDLGLAMLHMVRTFKTPSGEGINVRIGVHSGMDICLFVSLNPPPPLSLSHVHVRCLNSL